MRWTNIGPYLSRFVIALVVSSLWFAPYASRYLSDYNRWAYLWELRNALVLCGVIAAIAVLFQLAYEVPRALGWNRTTRGVAHVYLLVLGCAILNNVAYQFSQVEGFTLNRYGVEMSTAWLGLAALVGYSYASRHDRIVAICRKGCLVLSPAIAICAIQLMRPIYYPQRLDPLPTDDESAAALTGEVMAEDVSRPAVYVILFDMWSYDRTFVDGQVRGDLPNLAALCEQATVYHAAQTPGDWTHLSIPRYLFNTDESPVVRAGRTGFERDGAFVDSRDMPSIMDHFSQQGYHTACVGFAQPYATWLGDRVDTLRSYSWHDHPEGIVAEAIEHFSNAQNLSTDPWSKFITMRREAARMFAFYVGIRERMLADMLHLTSKGPRRLFAFVHYPLPHYPFLLDDQGNVRTPDLALNKGTLGNYNNNLKQMDCHIGRLVDGMKKAGRFDHALIVLTSDHSWRNDPAMQGQPVEGFVTHVPLIIKAPRQFERFDVKEKVEIVNLVELTAAAAGGEAPSSIDSR